MQWAKTDIFIVHAVALLHFYCTTIRKIRQGAFDMEESANGKMRNSGADPPPPAPMPDPREQLRHWRRLCAIALKRAELKLGKQQAECDAALKEAWYRQIADSLLADPGLYPRGSAECDVINVHTSAVEKVKLNPAFDASENAELLYKKARKAHRGLEIIRANIQTTRESIRGLQAIIAECERLIGTQEIAPEALAASSDAVVPQLQEIGILPKTIPTPGAAPAEKTPYRHFRIGDYDVFIGRNDAQNDELSTRFARPWYIWMHVAAHSGSHVVIRRDKNHPWPPRDILEQTAALAAWFSKAKHATYVDVHATEARFVRKRRHSPPGEVIAERCKTISVAPRNPQEMFRNLPTDENSTDYD
jgi:predicted ribosome quality control (RQC) complex YloA/Tae2 family protein